MAEKIRFIVARDGWIEYEGDKPEGFDELDRDDQWMTLLELADTAKEVDGDTHQLNIYVGGDDNPL
jgi:hypothetical protein